MIEKVETTEETKDSRGKKIWNATKKTAVIVDPVITGPVAAIKNNYERKWGIVKLWSRLIVPDGVSVKNSITDTPSLIRRLFGKEASDLAADKEHIAASHRRFLEVFKEQGLTVQRLQAAYVRLYWSAMILLMGLVPGVVVTSISAFVDPVAIFIAKLLCLCLFTPIFLAYCAKMWAIRHQVMDQRIYFGVLKSNLSLLIPTPLPKDYAVNVKSGKK